ncbi:MAG: FAD/NAD(P)-binding protein [Planctomycetaceae bacterium]|nr:FAD/NAD(P)-binding protein [Planctomycetaceae bacterium]
MMHPTGGRLHELIVKLDALGTSPSLVDLAEAMRSVKLTIDDVAPYVRANPRHYNRALVVVRDHFELLVMTWRPGQISAPHDHAGSVCVLQVLQGQAIEGSFRVAADGYVDFDYETVVRCGEITAGQDAGVHTVRNADDANELLVTVHIYAPPLQDFRRFIHRPKRDVAAPTPLVEATPTIVVVGGGFSGSMTAAQILRKANETEQRVRVVVVERRGAVGEGLAYGTRDLNHLLNVPAGRMSAWPDRPDDFLQWAQRRRPQAKPVDFLPRQWYGEYVRETLLATAEEAKPAAEFSVVFDEVRRVARRPEGGWLVHLAHGSTIRADAVVLAIGHRPPSDPIGARWSGSRAHLIADPWRPFALNIVEPDEPVVVLGSGLTAVDAVLSLAHPDRRAPITIVSRRGLLPQSHAAQPVKPVDLQPMVAELLAAPGGVRVLELCRRLRKIVAESAAQGVDWRGVVDGIRPHTAALWQAMSIEQRRRFLPRLRPFWEVHRHRMALSIGEQFGELRDCDWVRRVAGRIVSVQADADAVRLVVSERATERLVEINAAWVINCTGPAPSNSAASNPAIGSLLVDHWLCPDELGLGLETTPGGNAIDAEGREVADLLVVGTLRKPAVWESTAVPELRAQAAAAAGAALQVAAR